MEIKTIINEKPKPKPDQNELGFGIYFTDHMFEMDYDEGEGWHDARIIPYGPLSLEPSALVFHYGQETFEGLKAYKNLEGHTVLFRPKENFIRMNNSNQRICMPTLDVDFVISALKQLVATDESWIPTADGTSLYVRPFMIATEPSIGVKVSKSYKFVIILSPVGAYYKDGLKPTKILVEENYIRAANGGTGEAKYGGNYAGSLLPYQKAVAKGFSQVMFLDGANKKFVEEVGTSNAFFIVDGVLYTSPLSGTILPGVTRDSVIKIARDEGWEVVEKALAIDDIILYAKQGKLDEVFASGTAAVVSPIGQLAYRDEVIDIGDTIGPKTQLLYDKLTGIQLGKIEDKFNWVERL
ncbi:MAG: branched-chain amino acid aminotransferase [Eubacteriaceae bacterium]|nr:branched-chain amino acid aminotransferase [Eubacteriaceae bacterium]